MIRIIAALDSNRGIGNNNGTPWHISNDLRRFRSLTSGQTIIMGHNTFKLLKGPFANRHNIVITRQASIPGVSTSASLLEAIASNPEAWIIGGAQVYAEAIEKADELYLTEITPAFNCTKFFPDFKDSFELVEASEKNIESSLTYQFTIYKRKIT